MNNRDPIYLYKFRSLSNDQEEWVQRIFQHNELWFSAPKDFNDPFDCLPVQSFEASDKVAAIYFDRLLKERTELKDHERTAEVLKLLTNESRNHRSKEFTEFMGQSLNEAVNSAGIYSMSKC